MSVVVAIKKNGKIYIGADSQVTRGGSRYSLSNPNNYKIWKVQGPSNCIMGHVGTVRDACVVRTMDNLVREIDVIHDVIGFDYLVNRIEPMIRDELKEHEFISKENPYRDMESRFLFAYEDQLFTIEYGAVICHEDFVAIGSGESEAVGSLLSTADQNLEPEERIVRAIKASAAHDIYVDYPIVITDTKSTEFSVITEKNEKAFLKDCKKKSDDEE